MPYSAKPPGLISRLSSTTWASSLAICLAANKPAGPAPITATRCLLCVSMATRASICAQKDGLSPPEYLDKNYSLRGNFSQVENRRSSLLKMDGCAIVLEVTQLRGSMLNLEHEPAKM